MYGLKQALAIALIQFSGVSSLTPGFPVCWGSVPRIKSAEESTKR